MSVPIRLILTPEDPSQRLADMDDDETAILAIIGPKGYLADLAAGFASFSENLKVPDSA